MGCACPIRPDQANILKLRVLNHIRPRRRLLLIQEGYLEEALKICNVLREFEICIQGGGPPAIVGFREHIFSGLGTLGTFASTAEMVFGTLVQRTLSRPLWCRYHYGHPDVMDKLALVAQVSSSTLCYSTSLLYDSVILPYHGPRCDGKALVKKRSSGLGRVKFGGASRP